MDDLPQQKDSDDQSGNEKDRSQTQQIQPAKQDNRMKPNFNSDWFDGIFKFLAAVAFVSWMIQEFVPDFHKLFLFIAIAFGLADAFYLLAHKIFKGCFWVFLCWIIYVFCMIEIFRNEAPPESKPHFTLCLRFGDSPKLYLTNEFLFLRHFENVSNFPDGSYTAKSFVNGCILIPILLGETNQTFTLIAKNDSNVKVTDLEASVGFPKEWRLGFDDTKWHKVDVSLQFPGFEFETSNMHFLAASSPYPLFPTDSLTFPAITNPCTVSFNGSTFKAGIIDICIRSSGFENIIAANIVFLPGSSNFTKPFIALGKVDADGRLHMVTSKDEIERSQK
jgi:hypothetical protein